MIPHKNEWSNEENYPWVQGCKLLFTYLFSIGQFTKIWLTPQQNSSSFTFWSTSPWKPCQCFIVFTKPSIRVVLLGCTHNWKLIATSQLVINPSFTSHFIVKYIRKWHYILTQKYWQKVFCLENNVCLLMLITM